MYVRTSESRGCKIFHVFSDSVGNVGNPVNIAVPYYVTLRMKRGKPPTSVVKRAAWLIRR